MKYLYLTLLPLVLLFASCKTTAPVVVKEVHTDTLTITSTVTLHDTVIQTESDFATFEALVSCDSANQALLTQVTTRNGQTAHINHTKEQSGRDLRVLFNCVCDSQSIYFTWKERDTTINRHTADVLPKIIEIPAKLNWWQLFCIRYGPWAFGLIGLLALWRLVKWLLQSGVTIPKI